MIDDVGGLARGTIRQGEHNRLGLTRRPLSSHRVLEAQIALLIGCFPGSIRAVGQNAHNHRRSSSVAHP